MLENYNFGLDETINSGILRQTADYAVVLKGEGNPFIERFKTALSDYKYKLTNEVDYPWNVFVLMGYALMILLAWKNKSYAYIWKLPFLFFVRTGLWMYIIMGNRYPVRITHSLYFMELVLLAALLLEECRKEYTKGQEKYAAAPGIVKGWQSTAFTILVVAVLGMLGLQSFSYHVSLVSAECDKRDYANREIDALTAYCRENKENFYFVDVYSAVSCTDFVMSQEAIEYSEKAFKDVDNSLSNYDLMGGWVVKSPLTDKKLQNFNMEKAEDMSAMERGLLDSEQVYVIIKSENSMDWLTGYFEEKRGIQKEAVAVDTIRVDGNQVYTVYAVR